jgi:hypothetical protein
MEWTMPTPLFYQLIHKPTINRQLLALPRKDRVIELPLRGAHPDGMGSARGWFSGGHATGSDRLPPDSAPLCPWDRHEWVEVTEGGWVAG